jgi:hypothetical protein
MNDAWMVGYLCELRLDDGNASFLRYLPAQQFWPVTFLCVGRCELKEDDWMTRWCPLSPGTIKALIDKVLLKF